MSAAPDTMSTKELTRNSSSRRRMLGGRGDASLIAFPKISEAAHGPDVHACWFDFRAQAGHVDLDRIGRELLIETEEASAKLLLAQYASGASQEQLEQRPFPRSEIHLPVPDLDALGGDVDIQARDRPPCSGRHNAPEKRSHSRFELGERERLRQIVFGAEIEPVHAIFDRVARGENENHRRGVSRAQAAQHLEAIEIGQPDVEHDEIELFVGERSICLLAGRGASHRMPSTSQYFDEPVCEERVIFNDENTHDGSPMSAPPGRGRQGYQNGTLSSFRQAVGHPTIAFRKRSCDPEKMR